MAKFDFIEATSAGYSFVWRERQRLLRLSAVPLALKVLCFAVVYWFGLEHNFLRQGLVFLPAYFAEGWVLAYAVRMAMYGEDGPLLRGSERFQALEAAVVWYMLIKVFSSVSLGGALNGHDLTGATPAPADTPGEIYFFLIAALVFFIWAFRLIWLYVPAAMGIPVRAYLSRVSAFSSSFPMIAMWLVVFVPIAVVMLSLAQMLQSVFPGSIAEETSLAFKGGMIIVQSVLELLTLCVSSVAMAHGVRQMMEGGR